MAATNIDEIFGKIKEDFVQLSQNAAREAATRAQINIRQKADKFIDEYYQYKPKIYKKRKMALYKLVQKYYKEKKTSDGIVIEFGVEYNPSNIWGIHNSMSPLHQSGNKWISRNDSGFNWDSGDNGIPEPEWITEKFLAGEHPWAQTDSESPDQKMKDFFNTKLENLVHTYISDALLDAVKTYF
jgi:hypothetical protein